MEGRLLTERWGDGEKKKIIKSRNCLKFVSVLLSASVETVGVSRMRDFLEHFSASQNFWNFLYTFVHPNSPHILAKSVPKLLDLVKV